MAGMRVSFAAMGGVRHDRLKVTKPDEQVAAQSYNALQWQNAAAGRGTPLAWAAVAADGTRIAGAEFWNDADAVPSRVVITHTPGTGVYVLTANASYPDWQNVSQPVTFSGAHVSINTATFGEQGKATIDSPAQVTVRTWNAAGALTDKPFTVEIK